MNNINNINNMNNTHNMNNLNIINVVNNNLIQINGRCIYDENAVHFFWAGSSIEFNIKASELWVNLEGLYDQYEHFIAFEINGMVCERLMLDYNISSVPIFRNFNKDKVTHVRIIKDVPAFPDNKHVLNIYSIKTDGELVPLEKKKLKIEFIGDSINSGEGAIGTGDEEDWISHFFSHVRSYPYMVGQLLNADYRVFSQSGWGVTASWDNNPSCALPDYYEEIYSLASKNEFIIKEAFNKNDFSSWQPDIIMCNLGTNDVGAFHNAPFIDENGKEYKMHMNGEEYDVEDIEYFKERVLAFLYKLRKNNPNAKIYWPFGILGDSFGNYIQEVINKFNKDNNDSVKYFILPITEGDEFGARLHPGILSHKKSAYVIANVIKDDFNIDKLERLIL